MGNFTTLEKIKNKLFAFIFWLIIWASLSVFIDNDVFLPGPLATTGTFLGLVRTQTFWLSIINSIKNIGLGFSISILLGIGLALISYFIPISKEIISLPINTLSSIPIASITIILLTWMSSRNLSLFIVLLIGLPNIYFSSLSGLENVDPALVEMAQVFGVDDIKIFKFIHLDKLKEFLLPNLLVTSGLAWKSGVSGEVLGLVGGSIGENIYYSKLYLNTKELLAWTFTIIILANLFQFILGKIIKEVR